MRTAAIVLLLTSLAATAGAQSAGARSVGDPQVTLHAFNPRRRRTQRIGVIAPTLWAGLIGASRELSGRDLTRSIEAQHNLEKVYLGNVGLDRGYIMGGLYLPQVMRVIEPVELPVDTSGPD